MDLLLRAARVIELLAGDLLLVTEVGKTGASLERHHYLEAMTKHGLSWIIAHHDDIERVDTGDEQ